MAPATIAMLAAATTNTTTATTTFTNGYRNCNGRKKSLSNIVDTQQSQNTTDMNAINNNHHKKRDYEEGVQPAKVFKVYNGYCNSTKADNALMGAATTTTPPTTITTATAITAAATKIATALATLPTGNLKQQCLSTNGVGQLQLTQVVGGGNLVVSPSFITRNAQQQQQHHHQHQQQHQQQQQQTSIQKILSNCEGSNEITRLPGGAELNIIPGGGSNVTATAAFYHANGKLTLVNGNNNNGILLKDSAIVTPVTASATPTPLCLATANGLTPLIVTKAINNNINNNNINANVGSGAVQYTGNFAQLIATNASATQAAAAAASTNHLLTNSERLNGKVRTKRV